MSRTTIARMLFTMGLVLAGESCLLADASVTAATGGTAISADTAGGAYTTLSGPRLRETDKAGISVGSIVLNAPAGFEFDPAATVTVAVTGKGKGTDLVLSNAVATVTTNTVTVYVASPSTSNGKRSFLTWSGIRVRPTVGTPLASGHITRGGSATFAESGSVSNYGALAEVPGIQSGLVVTLPNQTFTAGSGLSGTVVVQTAGVPFNLARLTAVDGFLNVVTNYRGAKTIAYSGPGGSPSYTTSVSFTNGQSTTTLATTLRKAETTTLTVSDGTVAGPASSPITVTGGAFARLLLLVPGETAAPGTVAGKTGTPAAQTAGTPFTVTVLAVDTNWNLVVSATDTVAIAASDANAIPPSHAALAGGTVAFNVALPTAGAQTVSATNVSAPTMAASVSPPITVNPGPLQRLQILVPGETAAPGTTGGKTGAPLAQVAGTAFTATVHAVDAFWNIVPVSDFVRLSSSDAHAALPDPAALAGGSHAFACTLRTLGSATLTASDLSDLSVTEGTTPPITVAAAPFTRLQLLVPGETAAPGSPTGKTGAPLPQSVGVAFPVTVNAVDDDWNIVATVTDVVRFAASGPAALPPDAALVSGTNRFSVALGSVGSHTIAVSDFTDASKTSCTSAPIPVGIAELQPATGGAALSADTAGGAYTELAGPVIVEGSPGNVGPGTIVLAMPAGFVVNTGHTVTVTVTGTGEGSDVALVSATATISAATIAVTVNAPSTSNRTSTLTWSGIQVRPAAGTPLVSGTISNLGSAAISGIPAAASFGELASVAGAAERLTVQVQPSATATAGTAFARQPAIRIEDQFGNLRSADNTTVVTAARGSGSGDLQGTLSALAVDGVASFADLTQRAAGTITVAFSAPGMAGAVSDNVVVSPAAATRLAFVQPPTDALAGATLAPAVTVQVQDPFSNAVPGAGQTVDLALGSGTDPLLGATSAVTDVSGLATFGDLRIEQAGVKALTAAAAGLTPAVSAAFTIAPAAASRLAFVQPPTDAVAGSTIAPAVTVRMEDAFGNAVTNAGVSIGLALSAGTGTLDGTSPRATAAGGVATFGDLSVAAAGAKQLTAASTGLTPAVSGSFTIAPADYTRMQILVPGETAAPGTLTGKTGAPDAQTLGVAFTVRVNAVDAYWNTIASVSNLVDLYSSDTAATFAPTSANLAGGTRTFSVTFGTVGNATVSAEDLVDANIADDTSPNIAVGTRLVSFQVASIHGSPAPATGTHAQVWGTLLTNTVAGTDTHGGTQYVCTGWAMTGNAPAGGTGNSFAMTITNDCALTWLWATNVALTASAGANGSVTGATNGWYAAGSAVTVTAVAASYYRFAGWSGDAQGDPSHATMSLTMDQPRAVTAAFVEALAAQGTPHWWLAQYGLTNGGFTFDAAETNDTDADLSLNGQEYVAGTDPTNAASYFHIAAASNLPAATVYFQSATGRAYGLLCTTNLAGGAWSAVPGQTNLSGSGAVMSLVDTNTAPLRYYRLTVVKP